MMDQLCNDRTECRDGRLAVRDGERFSVQYEVLMINVIVSESVIQCILDFYAKNNEANYQIAKACQDSHENDMTATQRKVVDEAEARCLASMNDPLRFL